MPAKHAPPETGHRFTLYGGLTCEACWSGSASTGPCRPRRSCTSENPMVEDGGRWQHPEAVVTRKADDIAFSAGNRTHYRCPACGTAWSEMEADS